MVALLIGEVRAQVGACSEAVDGYASLSGEGFTSTTGGTGGTVATVTNLADLTTWAADREKNTAAGILYISGKIESPASMILTIKNGANISIIGKNGGELKNIGLNIRDYNNVIIQNLKIHEVLYPNDALTLDNVNHGWVNHCEMYSTIGPGVGYDTYDGLLDVKNGSRFITLSWNRLHDHMKVMLIGHTDNVGSQTIDEKIQVSLHHNFFYNTDGRNPSLRWGTVHSYNNYFRSISDYGMASRRYSHVKIENNVYKNVKQPITTDNFIVVTGDDGSVCESGSQFIDCGANSITQTNCAWWTATTLPYQYTLTPTASVASLVKSMTAKEEPSLMVWLAISARTGTLLMDLTPNLAWVLALPPSGSVTVKVKVSGAPLYSLLGVLMVATRVLGSTLTSSFWLPVTVQVSWSLR